MNQKNAFTVIAIILVAASALHFFMGGEHPRQMFPGLSESSYFMAEMLMEVVGVNTFLIALITFAVRKTPAALGAYVVGFFLIGVVAVKHAVLDGVDVPIQGLIIPFCISLLCGYLWLMQNKSPKATAAI